MSLVVCTAFAAEESSSVFSLAERFFSDSLYNLALEQYTKYLDFSGRRPENDAVAHYKSAVCRYRMGNYRKASEEFERYAELFPGETNVMEALYTAAVARKKLGDHKEASDLFYAVWSRFVGSVKGRDALFQAAHCAEKDGNTDRAVELYDIYVARFPKDSAAPEAAIALAKLHIEQNRYSEASQALKKVSGSDGASAPRVFYLRAVISDKMQKSEAAAEFFKKMDEAAGSGFPEADEAYEAYGDYLISAGRLEHALEVFEKRADMYRGTNREPPEGFRLSWAETARKVKNYSVAAKIYTELVENPPREFPYGRTMYRLAESRIGLGDFAGGIGTLQRLAAMDSVGEYADQAVLKIGDLYFAKGMYPSAIAAYRRYLRLPVTEEKDRVLFQIGMVYKGKYRRFGAAIREFENLLKWYPESPHYGNAALAIGECYEETGEYRSAIRQYEFLLETVGDDSLVQDATDRIEYLETFQIRDPAAAASRLADILQVPPDSLAQWQRLWVAAETFERDLRDYPKALRAYERISELGLPTDSLRALVVLRRAGVYQKISEKARFEKDTATSNYSREKALGLYGRILESERGASCADEAAYNRLVLTSANIAEFENFLTKYPQSDRLPEVLGRIAQHYERRSAAAGETLSRNAVEAYRRIVSEYPSSRQASHATIGLARGFLTLGELDSVLSMVDRYLERFPNAPGEPEAYYMKGVVAKRRGNYEEAGDVFQQVLYRYPFSALAGKARFELAFAQLSAGKVFDALNNFQLFEHNHPTAAEIPNARYGIAQCLLRTGKTEEGVGILEELLEKDLSSSFAAQVRYELGRAAEGNGDFYKALGLYRKVLEYDRFQKRGPLLHRVGDLYFESRIYGDAASAYKKSLEFAESESDSVRLLARAIVSLTMNGNSRDAEKALKVFKDRFGEKDDALSEIIYYEGVHYLIDKNYEKAVSRFKYVQSKFSSSEWLDDAEYQIGLSYFYSGKKDEALSILREFPEKYPGSKHIPAAYFKIATILHGKGEYAQSADWFSKVLSLSGVDDDTRFRSAHNAAAAYQKISAWQDAVNMYGVVLDSYSDKIDVSSLHLKMGFCMVQASRIEDALVHFLAAGENPSPEDKPEITYWIATCYGKLGQYQKAIGEYLKVPYLFSGVGKWGVTAEFEAARLYERLGEYAKARTLYQKIVRSDGERGRFGKQALERISRLENLGEG